MCDNSPHNFTPRWFAGWGSPWSSSRRSSRGTSCALRLPGLLSQRLAPEVPRPSSAPSAFPHDRRLKVPDLSDTFGGGEGPRDV